MRAPVLALLLDIDGTLLDTLDAIVEAMNLALAEVGERPLRTEELRPLIGMPVERQMEMLRGTDPGVSARIADRYYAHFHRLVDRGVRLYPGVAETLEALAARPIATMSTRRRDEARHMLRAAGIDSYFREIVGGDEVRRPKPDPDLALHAARALGVPPSEAAVVGDSPVDLQAGRAAGARTVAAMYGYGHGAALERERPDARVDRFGDLPRELARLERG